VYSSPEVLLNRKIDHKVDVWSFGMTLYELWSGVVPWRDNGNSTMNSVTSVISAVMEQKRPFLDLPAIPAELKKMIGECWSEEAKDRPEFVATYQTLCVDEFEETGLQRLTLGGSSTSSSTSNQGFPSFFFSFLFSFEANRATMLWKK